MSRTTIAWTESTWNPVSGCTKISAGCVNCYAERMARRLRAIHPHKYSNGFAVTLHPEELEKPSRWRKPRKVFVCSMGDLFHEDVPDEFLRSVFDVMRNTPQHTYQVLTKRAERMTAFAQTIEWPDNVWAGVTVEHHDYVHRADFLRQVPAPVRFISAEPLVSALPELDLTCIHQLIVGGESGPGWRSMDIDWVRDLHDSCIREDVAFFFKQFAGFQPKKLGRELDGVIWDEMPKPATDEDAA